MALVKVSNAPEKPLTNVMSVGGGNKEAETQQKM